jgi:uncharacterized RDD family membrane protein YckC
MSQNLRIGIISLVIVLLGILNFKHELAWAYGYGSFTPPAFYMTVRPFAVKIPFIPYPIDILVCITLMIAAVLYMVKNKGLTLIAFIFSLMFAQSVGRIVLFIARFAISAPREREPVISLIVPVLLTTASFYVLYLFKQTWDTKPVSEKTEATKLQRFLAYSVDVIVFAILALPRLDLDTLPFYQRLLIMFLAYVFFVSFERLFLFTPGKIALNTRVCSEDGGAPTESSIFIRNLCRFIPFEALSFFGKKGWHDSISKTSVFKYFH